MKKVIAQFLDLLLNIRVYFRRNLSNINIILLLVFIVLISIRFLDKDLFTNQTNNLNIDYLNKISSIIFQFITILAIIIGGLFSYYKFIRGRIYKPKIDIEVKKNIVLVSENKIAILRCTIKNIGNIRIRPILLEGVFFYGRIKDNVLKYIMFEKRENLLNEYFFNNSQKFFLEPGDKMEIDIDVILDKKYVLYNNKKDSNCLLRVNFELIDNLLYKWNHNSVISID